MIGPKKLSTIRQELQEALTATGEDPIRWLEERMTTRLHSGADESEVLQSLQRFLAAPGGKKRRKQQAGREKGREKGVGTR
jgi:hypothetical protein